MRGVDMRCPGCGSALRGDAGVYRCAAGCGQFLTLAKLRSMGVESDLVNELWRNAKVGNCRPGIPCPNCGRTMRQLKLGDETRHFDLDLCTGCQSLWFDQGELEQIPRPDPPVRQSPNPALDRLQPITTGSNDLPDRGGEELRRLIPALFGLPMERFPRQLSRIPFVTFGAALLCLAIHATLLWRGELIPAVAKWGMIPAQWMRYDGLTLVSSMFLHVGILHLLGNIYFLLMCGDDAEDVLGHGPYLLLLVLSGLSANFVHILSNGGSTVPCVGASGFISGIIAFYAGTFPRASLGICLGRGRFSLLLWHNDLYWLHLPAWAWFAIFVLLQLLGAWCFPNANIAWFAHLGGIIPGLVFAGLNRCGRDAPDVA